MSSSGSEFSGFEEDDWDIADINYSDLSDISVSSVNTSDISFSGPSDEEGARDIVFSDVLTPVNVAAFTHPNGVTHGLDYQTAKELDYFKLFITDAMLSSITDQTNLFAVQKQATKPDNKWTPTNKEEMQAYIGLNILMGIVVLPELSMYWSGNKNFGEYFLKYNYD